MGGPFPFNTYLFMSVLGVSEDPLGFSVLPDFIPLITSFLRSTIYLGGVSLSSIELITHFLRSIVSHLSNPLLPTSGCDAIQTATTFLQSVVPTEHLIKLFSCPPVFDSFQPTPVQLLCASLREQNRLDFIASEPQLFRLQADSQGLETREHQQLLNPPRSPRWIDVLSSSILQALSSDVSLAAATANLVESIRLLFIIVSITSLSVSHRPVGQEISCSAVEDLLVAAAWLMEIQVPRYTTPVAQWRWCIRNSSSYRHFIKETCDSQVNIHSTLHAKRILLKTILRKFCGRGGVKQNGKSS